MLKLKIFQASPATRDGLKSIGTKWVEPTALLNI